MSQLRLCFLGPPQIEIDGEPVSITRRKSLAILAFLAVTGEPQRRDTLATLLWPESDQSRARTSLRRDLWDLNQTLGQEWLAADRETAGLQADADIWIDAEAFEANLAELAEIDADTAYLSPQQIDRIERAAGLYRGDFLTGFTLPDCPEFDDWQFFQAEGYRQQLAAALEMLITVHARRGEHAAALSHARRWLALDPLHEPAHRQLMVLYALAGQQAAALRQYQECKRILAEELGTPPEEETSELHEAIRTRRFPSADKVTGWQGDKVTESPPSSPHAVTTSPIYNLPAQTTPLVGRDQEVTAVLDLLARSGCRLITITGAGGMGKTRLSIAVAAEAAPRFADGICFVPLADVETPQAIPSAIAAQLDLPATGTADARQRLHDTLRTKSLLLVLDNFEHLVAQRRDSPSDGAEYLSDLLQQAPHLTLLVTSQERLNLVEEWLYPLEGLSYPPEEMSDSGEEYGAIALFAQCAYKSQPDFDPDAEQPHIVSICRLVEGMPLGIELAASWVRALSCAEIAAELGRDLDFLTTPLRNLPTRHRSLRALFDRSWTLLSPQEQAVLRRLAVFRGGFDRTAAAEVAGATPLLLTALVDRSLIRRQLPHRFDMHGLLHQFVAKKLAEQPEEETQTQARHAAFYAALVARAGWELEPGDPKVNAALDRESANVLAAWRWAIEQKHPDVVQKIMKWLVNDFRRRGDKKTGAQNFAEAIQVFRSHKTSHVGELAGLLGSLLLRQAQCTTHASVEEAIVLLEESVALLRQASPPDPVDLALALVSLSLQYASRGHNAQGETVLAEGLALFRRNDSPLGIGATLRDWGMLEMGWGRLHLAQQRLEESVRLLETHDRAGYMQSTFILGTTLLMRGHYRRAEALIQRALRFFIEHQEKELAGHALRNLGDLYTAAGAFDQAEQTFAGATAYFEPVGREGEVTTAICISPAVLARLQGRPDAERLLTDAVVTARRVGFQQRIATSLHHLSRLRHDQRDYEGALALLDEALSIARHIDYRYATALVLAQQGHSHLSLNQTDEARRAFAEALQIAGDEGIDRVALDALRGVATLLAREGDDEQAIPFLRLAQEHPASEYETKCLAQDRLREVSQATSAAAVQGRNTDPPLDLAEAIHLALQRLQSQASVALTQKSGPPPQPQA